MEIIEEHLDFRHDPRDRAATNRIVVHHTAGPADQLVGEIHAYHKQKGWNGIGYNLVQGPDARWYSGRGIDKEGAHATGYNRNSIGICLIGNFESHHLSVERWKSLIQMCNFLCDRYNLEYTDVVGHKELPGAATLCPGRNIDLPLLRRSILQTPGLVNTPVYRVVVDKKQVGAYTKPYTAIERALSDAPDSILIQKV